MLNWTEVFEYVKGSLSLPSTFIEKTDKEIKNWIIRTAIPEFSKYYPDVEYTAINPTSDNYRVNGKNNIFAFFDEEDLPIYGIIQCYFPVGDMLADGHPTLGAMSVNTIQEWALQVFRSNLIKPVSNFNKNYKFIRPNFVMILPESDDTNIVIEYERKQPLDLRKIPAELEKDFLDLALAECMIWIGRLRSNYGDGRLSTPFGEIPLSGDTLKSDGQELKRETIEKLSMGSMPSVLIDIS